MAILYHSHNNPSIISQKVVISHEEGVCGNQPNANSENRKGSCLSPTLSGYKFGEDKHFQTEQNARRPGCSDCDVKMVKIGFSLEFCQIIVLTKVTKLLVGMLLNLKYAFKTGLC